MRLDNLQHEAGGDGSIEGVAALFQYGHADGRGNPVGGGNNAKGAENFRPGGKVSHSIYPRIEMMMYLSCLRQDERGSRTSRSPSPRRLNPMTTRKIAPPGQMAIHGA